MKTPVTVRQSAKTLDALMEAFETAFMEVVDLENPEMDMREKACYAFYGIRDMIRIIIRDMEDLAGHMEVCDAIHAVNHVKAVKGEV